MARRLPMSPSIFPDLTPRKGSDMLREIFAMKFVRRYSLVVAGFFIAWCGVARAFGAGDTTPAAGATPAPAGAPEMVDGYLKIGFDRLGSFPFVGDCLTENASATETQIP